MIAQAQAAACVGAPDMAALRLAATQQNLMVAAFSCHAVRDYNRFVIEHQAELQASDARLKDFFTARSGRGIAGYHLFKTELANAASLRSIRDTANFCADAEDTFAWAQEADHLSRTISALPVTWAAAYHACTPNGGSEAMAPEPARLAYGRGPHPRVDDRDFDGPDADHDADERDTDGYSYRDDEGAPPRPAPFGRPHHQVDLDEDL